MDGELTIRVVLPVEGRVEKPVNWPHEISLDFSLEEAFELAFNSRAVGEIDKVVDVYDDVDGRRRRACG